MILEGIFHVFVAFLDLLLAPILNLLPPPPDWVGQGFDALAFVWVHLHDFDAWLPVSLTLTCVLAVFAAYLTTIGLELARMILSFLTFGGGAK